MDLDVRPLTPDRWDDVVSLFKKMGPFAGCWCMYFRLRGRDFDQLGARGRREAFEALVRAGQVPGLLAYHDDVPVGWCSVDERDAYPRILRSPVAKPVDDRPAMSAVCFFVDRPYRQSGVADVLLAGAISHARSRGASLLEGYPVEPPVSSLGGYHGVVPMFARAGFQETARRRPNRPLMRLELG
jgi:GNAT superfamily N-acetyltransferase